MMFSSSAQHTIDNHASNLESRMLKMEETDEINHLEDPAVNTKFEEGQQGDAAVMHKQLNVNDLKLDTYLHEKNQQPDDGNAYQFFPSIDNGSDHSLTMTNNSNTVKSDLEFNNKQSEDSFKFHVSHVDEDGQLIQTPAMHDYKNEMVVNRNGEDLSEQDSLSELSPSFKSGTNSILHVSREKNFSRRVSFPEGDNIISGYNEPRNPWADAPSASTEELIQAYVNSCEEWGVKPITKLLLQLQEIRDFSVRTHSLTLKGEKVDIKVVETLEAVLKRVQFVIMDLEATNLDDDSAAALFDMIEYYESAVNILVGFNKNLGTRGWQAAAHMMRKMSCLRLFDGHSVPLSDQAVPFVGRALRLSHTLVTLHLENSALSGRPILLIVAALRMNVTLQELFLADNHLMVSDALQIGNLLKFNQHLTLLDVRNNLIQDAGLSHLCNGLQAQGQSTSSPGFGLQTLVLWNNQISHRSMNKLTVALRQTTSLTTLNLGQNVLGDEGASRLKDGLLQNRSLLRLGLVGTKLTCEGAIALAEFLVESARIIRLDLRNNNIKVAGLIALSLAAKINLSLLRLDIDKPTTKDTIKELAEKQESVMKDVNMYANRNKELALRKVLRYQEQREKSEDQTSAAAGGGLRYMDMTTSTSTEQQQSTADSATTTAGTSGNVNNNNHLTSHVDDSPTNSPELLPTKGVSYHQVSPVIMSSSEMEKQRAHDAMKDSQAQPSPGDQESIEQPATCDEDDDDAIPTTDAGDDRDVTPTTESDDSPRDDDSGDASAVGDVESTTEATTDDRAQDESSDATVEHLELKDFPR